MKKYQILTILALSGLLLGQAAFADVSPVVAINSLNPASGTVGTSITVSGSGFTSTENTVSFGNFTVIPHLNSDNGTTLMFTVPSYGQPACSLVMPPCLMATFVISPGVYEVSVINANGKSNILNFTVTGNVTPPPSPSPTPTPTPLPPIFSSSTLVNDNGTIFVVENNQKQGIVSMGVFQQLGYKLSNVVNGDTSTIPSGPAITDTQLRHPEGSLLLDSGTVFYLGSDTRYPFPSAAVFLSWGNKFSDVVQANSADLSVPTGTIVQTK